MAGYRHERDRKEVISSLSNPFSWVEISFDETTSKWKPERPKGKLDDAIRFD
jgi:hypothetical protein